VRLAQFGAHEQGHSETCRHAAAETQLETGAASSGIASSTRRTCSDVASSDEKTPTVAMPRSAAVRATRMAISPRFAISRRFDTDTMAAPLSAAARSRKSGRQTPEGGLNRDARR